MSGFEDALNKILSSPEDMAKIADIAKSFGGSAAGDADGASASAGGTASTDGDTSSPLSLLGSLDPKMLASIGRLMGEYSGKNDKAALFAAIAPYLKEEQRTKLTRASEIAKLARVARVAFKEFDLGGILGV